MTGLLSSGAHGWGSSPMWYYTPFWFWMYCLTVSRLTAPTVLMKADLVHMFGSRETRSGYSCLMIREVPPLSFLTQFMICQITCYSAVWHDFHVKDVELPFFGCFLEEFFESLVSVVFV